MPQVLSTAHLSIHAVLFARSLVAGGAQHNRLMSKWQRNPG